MIDIILVKYCLNDSEEKVFGSIVDRLLSCNVLTVKVWENTATNNVGLSRARNRILKTCDSEYICFMDFDISDFHLDWHSLTAKLRDDIVMTVPWCPGMSSRNNEEWQEKFYIPCNCMVMKTDFIRSLGGFDERFFVAYADWDLLKHIWENNYKVFQHNKSWLRHIGLSNNNPKKRMIWKSDYQAFLKKWGSPLDRSKA